MKYLKKHARDLPMTGQRRIPFYMKVFFIILACAACIITIFSESIFLRTRGDISCFYQHGNLLTELNAEEPLSGASIFFHETSCHDNIDIHFKPRQACSVESALLAHPEKSVFLLVSKPVLVPLDRTNNILIRELLTYKNFRVRHVSFSKYLSDTPLAGLGQRGVLSTESLYPVAHASDILRYATLYKFDGIYLDLDVLVLKPLGKLMNFAGAESNTSIGSGILGFGSDAVGREIARDCVDELRSTFNGRVWGHNGPGVITRVLQRRCNTSSIIHMTKERCQGFDAHPVESFAPLSFRAVNVFFKEDTNGIISKLLHRSYVIHFWNKFSSNIVIQNNSNIPFIHYARTYCPKVFKIVNGEF